MEDVGNLEVTLFQPSQLFLLDITKNINLTEFMCSNCGVNLRKNIVKYYLQVDP